MKTKFISLLLTLLFSNVLISGNPDLFYYVADASNELYSINRTTGATTLIGPTGVSRIEAIAYYPIPGANQLFATDAGNFGSLNISTGAFTFIGEVDGGGTANGAQGAQTLNDVDGLMLDGQTFKMWAIERNGGAALDYLFQINVITGQFVPNAFGAGIDYLVISGTGVDVDCDDLAVDPSTGRVYANSNNNGVSDVLIEINKFTGVFRQVSTLSEDEVEGLSFSNNGILYGSEGDADNRLSQVNISSGLMNNFFPFTGSDVEGLACLVADANTVNGNVFNDLDLDGVKDIGESGLANVQVYLYYDNNSNGQVDPEDTKIQTALTDVNGDYTFYFATTGNLVVSTEFFSYPTNFALTTDNVETISFTDNINFAEIDANNNFGLATGTDCDGDGLPNFYEGAGDSDLDAIADSCDLDSDNDGIRDDVEGTEDFDDDGIPDYLDRDSDDDGIPDAIEANGGIAPSAYNASLGMVTGTDSDGNGIVDALETTAGSGVMNASVPDSDNDGRKDYRDLDSDNDGILDIIEAGGTDSDGDGQVDEDADFNQNGFSDLLEGSPLSITNTDIAFEAGNGLSLRPDYIDIDSDADGIDDTREGYSTANYTFPSLILDSDADGIVDFWDVSTFEQPISPNDNDGDGIPDYQDTDSDNDGVSDAIEGNDANNDGLADLAFSGNDANGNGLDDAFDANCSQSVNAGASDWGEENNSNGSMYLTSSDLELCDDGGTNQTVGIYFPGVAVNQGETINSAFIQFQADESDAAGLTITIRGELSSSASSFTSTVNNVSSRTTTLNSETWAPAAWTAGDEGTAQLTVDISSIIQEIVNQGAWVFGNNMVLIFTSPSGNERTAEVDPILIINTDAIVCSSIISPQDFDGDGEDDFRDTDDDGDGIPTLAEIPDSEPNGTPDYLEDNSGPCGLGLAQGYTYATFESDVNGVTDNLNAEGAPDGNFAQIYNNNETLTLDFGQVFTAGTQYEITWRKKTSDGSTNASVIDLSESTDNVSYTNHPTSPTTTNKVNFITTTVTSNVDFRYLRFDKGNSSTVDYELDAVGVISCSTDSDFDGIDDATDLDDDNDGILDLDENASCSGFLNYEFYDSSPPGSTVDNIPTTGELSLGTYSSFDADALQNEVDPFDTDLYAIRYTGFITVATSETYTFYTTSDDGSKLFVNGIEVLDNDGLHAARERSGDITLTAGTHSFMVLFFERTGADVLSVSYSSASIAKMEIPFSVLSTTSSCDSDQDGVSNQLDLDSDNDGIADIIEAGGVDIDNNGRADSYSDGDSDGWMNTFDPDNGGTVLADSDADGDGFANRIDVDSDGDGIVDLIEAQLSGTNSISPAGTDADSDGIDDNFDANLGASLLIPINTDETDNPDYLDSDSDNDGDLDILEAWDTDNDGTANIAPAGSDADADGLDDNFDNQAGINTGTNISNGSQTSSSFPNLDNTITSERDWREFNDHDGDGISDAIDIDDDNDGIPDDAENSLCTSGLTESLHYEFYDSAPAGNSVDNIPTSGANATGSTTEIDVDNLYLAITPADNNTFSVRYTGYLSISTSETYTFYTSSDDGSKLYIDGNEVVDNDGTHGITERSGSIALTPGLYPISILFFEASGGEFLSVSYESGTIAKTLIPFSVLTEPILCDTDGDGIPNQIDLDSDGDGISDIVESGGVDADGNGRADAFTDTDLDGWANTFDSNNGGTALADEDKDLDGIPNRIDLDSDNDGIADVIEAGGVDANNDGKADGTDSNTNGWVNTHDAEETGTSLNLADKDGDGLVNYLDFDSDSDGLNDNFEGQTTANFRSPQNLDTDGDGWDDEYDSDNAGTAILLSNNNGAGDPDYLDSDSDGDGLVDWMEGFDDNNTEDALDDFIVRAVAFELAAGSPMFYVTTDDADSDGVPDFLEDDDANGIPNFADINSGYFHDTDADGLIDLVDPDNSGTISSQPDFDGDGEYDFRDTDNQISLPVELLDFTANIKDSWTQLDWTTLSETNNQAFQIERLNLSGVFESIETIAGAGYSSSTLFYRSFDKSPLVGDNYYRLKQIDFDGKQSYSVVRRVNFIEVIQAAKSISLYPNPNRGNRAILELRAVSPGNYHVQLINSLGSIVENETLLISAEQTVVKIELIKGMLLNPGMYYVRIKGNELEENLKLMVR